MLNSHEELYRSFLKSSCCLHSEFAGERPYFVTRHSIKSECEFTHDLDLPSYTLLRTSPSISRVIHAADYRTAVVNAPVYVLTPDRPTFESPAGSLSRYVILLVNMFVSSTRNVINPRGNGAICSETQAIKSEMECVQSKLERNLKLLQNHRRKAVERSRAFGAEIHTVAVEALLSASLIRNYREIMWQEWSSHLHEAIIKFKPKLSLTEYLPTADDRLNWQPKSLPSDNLAMEIANGSTATFSSSI
ncbi:hypothetical protein EDB19DRAFT_151878 [Suillus lakei]|nr:hypothetical protein EDB19DRAFT_151878 [Suillus lakei]